MYATLVQTLSESWHVLGQMSPYLLFGFLVAGLLSVCVSPGWIERHLGRRGFGPVLKASLFGVPLPLCSCGVIPVSASMYRHGASRAATTAFLLSTPQTGVDSIAITYALLGPVFAVFRPIAALLTGLVGGGLVQLFDPSAADDHATTPQAGGCSEDCCVDRQGRGVLARVMRYGFVTLPRDIGAALVVGIIVAGAMAALVPPNHLNAYIGGGVLSILLLMVAGVPIYVCATASVPIAAGFLHMGASPGAALAFLIAGPATNAATFTTIWKVLGRRTAAIYLVTVAVSAVVCGLILDRLMPAVESTWPALGCHDHSAGEAGWFYHAAAIVLLIVLGFSWMVGWRRRHSAEETEKDAGQDRIELRITGMTCSHCVESVRRALTECEGVESVDVDLGKARAVVTGQNLSPDQFMTAVAQLGYQASIIQASE